MTCLKQHLTAPERVVSLKNIAELKGIQESADALRIGAMTTLAELASHADAKKHFPALVTAAEGVGSAADHVHGHGRRRSVPAAALLVLPQRVWTVAQRMPTARSCATGRIDTTPSSAMRTRLYSSARPASGPPWSRSELPFWSRDREGQSRSVPLLSSSARLIARPSVRRLSSPTKS